MNEVRPSKTVGTPARNDGNPANAPRRQGGFTLVELMIVTVIIGILAAMGVNAYQKYLLKGELAQALPYLHTIASKMRQYRVRTGNYYAYTNDGSESELSSNLGVSLTDSADFCYRIVTGSSDMYSSNNNAVHFEVWAVARTADNSAVTTGYKAKTCTPLTTAQNKLSPQGWVSRYNIANRIVVFHYPPPTDGPDGNARDWTGGVSYTNATQ